MSVGFHNQDIRGLPRDLKVVPHEANDHMPGRWRNQTQVTFLRSLHSGYLTASSFTIHGWSSGLGNVIVSANERALGALRNAAMKSSIESTQDDRLLLHPGKRGNLNTLKWHLKGLCMRQWTILIDQKRSAQGKWLGCSGGWTDGERTSVPDPTKKVVNLRLMMVLWAEKRKLHLWKACRTLFQFWTSSWVVRAYNRVKVFV